MIELLETMPIPATNDDVNEWYQSQIYAQEPLHWTCFPFNNQTTAIPPEQQHLPPPTHFLILLHLFVCVRTTSDDSSAHFTSELHYSAFLHYSRSNWLLIIGIISIQHSSIAVHHWQFVETPTRLEKCNISGITRKTHIRTIVRVTQVAPSKSASCWKTDAMQQMSWCCGGVDVI